MPRRTPAPGIEQQARTEVDDELSTMAASIAAELGPAEGKAYASEAEELRAWGQKDPTVDYDTLVSQLMTGRLDPARVDPESPTALELVRADPAWARLLSQVTPQAPLDQEMAQQVATFAEYPFRLPLLAPYADDPKAHVAKANSLERRWLRQVQRPITDTAAVFSSGPGAQPAPAVPDPYASPEEGRF